MIKGKNHWEYLAADLQQKIERKEVAYGTLADHFRLCQIRTTDLQRDIYKYRRALSDIRSMIPEPNEQLDGFHRTMILQTIDAALSLTTGV